MFSNEGGGSENVSGFTQIGCSPSTERDLHLPNNKDHFMHHPQITGTQDDQHVTTTSFSSKPKVAPGMREGSKFLNQLSGVNKDSMMVTTTSPLEQFTDLEDIEPIQAHATHLDASPLISAQNIGKLYGQPEAALQYIQNPLSPFKSALSGNQQKSMQRNKDPVQVGQLNAIAGLYSQNLTTNISSLQEHSMASPNSITRKEAILEMMHRQETPTIGSDFKISSLKQNSPLGQEIRNEQPARDLAPRGGMYLHKGETFQLQMEKLTTLREVIEPAEISQVSDRLSSLRHSKHDDDEEYNYVKASDLIKQKHPNAFESSYGAYNQFGGLFHGDVGARSHNHHEMLPADASANVTAQFLQASTSQKDQVLSGTVSLNIELDHMPPSSVHSVYEAKDISPENNAQNAKVKHQLLTYNQQIFTPIKKYHQLEKDSKPSPTRRQLLEKSGMIDFDNEEFIDQGENEDFQALGNDDEDEEDEEMEVGSFIQGPGSHQYLSLKSLRQENSNFGGKVSVPPPRIGNNQQFRKKPLEKSQESELLQDSHLYFLDDQFESDIDSGINQHASGWLQRDSLSVPKLGGSQQFNLGTSVPRDGGNLAGSYQLENTSSGGGQNNPSSQNRLGSNSIEKDYQENRGKQKGKQEQGSSPQKQQVSFSNAQPSQSTSQQNQSAGLTRRGGGFIEHYATLQPEDEMLVWKRNRLIATMKLDIIDSESEYDDEDESEDSSGGDNKSCLFSQSDEDEMQSSQQEDDEEDEELEGGDDSGDNDIQLDRQAEPAFSMKEYLQSRRDPTSRHNPTVSICNSSVEQNISENAESLHMPVISLKMMLRDSVCGFNTSNAFLESCNLFMQSNAHIQAPHSTNQKDGPNPIISKKTHKLGGIEVFQELENTQGMAFNTQYINHNSRGIPQGLNRQQSYGINNQIGAGMDPNQGRFDYKPMPSSGCFISSTNRMPSEIPQEAEDGRSDSMLGVKGSLAGLPSQNELLAERYQRRKMSKAPKSKKNVAPYLIPHHVQAHALQPQKIFPQQSVPRPHQTGSLEFVYRDIDGNVFYELEQSSLQVEQSQNNNNNEDGEEDDICNEDVECSNMQKIVSIDDVREKRVGGLERWFSPSCTQMHGGGMDQLNDGSPRALQLQQKQSKTLAQL